MRLFEHLNVSSKVAPIIRQGKQDHFRSLICKATKEKYKYGGVTFQITFNN